MMDFIKIREKLNKEKKEIEGKNIRNYNLKERVNLNYETIINILNVLAGENPLKSIGKEQCKRVQDKINSEGK